MSDETISNGHQVLWNGKTVWVNSGIDGACIGRFCKLSAEMNLPATEQIETGAKSLESFRDPTMEGWLKFCGLMRKHYQVEVPTGARPKWLGITSKKVVETQPMAAPFATFTMPVIRNYTTKKLDPREMLEGLALPEDKAKISDQLVLDVDCAFDKETGEVIKVFNLNKVLRGDG